MNSRTSPLVSPGSARLSRILLAAVFAVAVFITPLHTFAQAPAAPLVVNEKNVEMAIKTSTIKSLGGTWWDSGNNEIFVGNKGVEVWSQADGLFDIRGWDHFTGQFVIQDQYDDRSYGIIIRVDDVVVYTGSLNKTKKELMIDIPITGRTKLSIDRTQDRGGWGWPTRDLPTIINSKLIKGNPVTYYDPDGLKMLVDVLCDQIDADPILKEKLSKANIGVASFSSINIPSATAGMAAAAAEDMTTALIKRKLPVIERGKIDALINGMGITDVANLTPDIATLLAKRTGCQYLVLGTFFDPGGITSKTVIANARIMDLNTGKSIAAERLSISKAPPMQAGM